MLRLTPVSKRLFTRQLFVSHNEMNVCWPQPDYGPTEVMRSDLLNGIKVASAKPLGAQIGACTIMYQAGSRYEVDDEIGASHFIRAASGASGCGYSSFLKSRYLQQCGGSITCTSDRQSVAFTLRCPITMFADLKNYLLDAAARCCYHQWEVDERKPMIREDLARIPPEQLVMDLIQKAAFRGPLANSVFCEEERIDDMSKETLLRFAQKNFKSVRCTVGSVGVPFEETLKMAERIELRRERPQDCGIFPSFPKSGYEFHDLGAGSDTWIALAVPGSVSCDITCLLKHCIIAAACGTGHIQVGQHDMDRTPQPPLGMMAGNDIYTEYKAFNISYFDQGIFGLLAKTRAHTATQAALCAAEFLANVGDLDFKQIDTGKRRLISEAKEKWRNIRSSYVRSKRPRGNKKRKSYYLGEFLEFVLPFMKPRGDSNELEFTQYTQEEEYGVLENEDQMNMSQLKEENTDDDDNDDSSENPLAFSLAESSIVLSRTRKRPNVDIEVDVPLELPEKKSYDRSSTQEIQSSSTTTTHVAPSSTHPMHYFFLSLMNEFDSMTENQTRRFKIKVLQLIDEIKRNE